MRNLNYRQRPCWQQRYIERQALIREVKKENKKRCSNAGSKRTIRKRA
jgi:hypothetical protein